MTRPKRPLTLADLTPREREHLELCVHEAGHAVAGVVLGGQLHNTVVTSSRIWGVNGLTTFSDRPHGRDSEIALAGPWSQARWRAGRRPTQRELFAVLKAGGHKDEQALIASGGTHLGLPVVPLIEMTWPAVVSVAQVLHRSGEASQAEVLGALGITDGGGRTSAQIASLRAGMHPVPPLSAPLPKHQVPA